jgi:diaminopimelate decarboxylase
MSAHALPSDVVKSVAEQYGTPAFVYDEAALLAQADKALALPAPFGLTVRFAIKALPTRAILRLFAAKGMHFDASSGYEVRRLLAAGIPAERISLSTQELPRDFYELIEAGIHLNACSLGQLESFGRLFPGRAVGLRFNPGLGSGGTNRTNVGGPASSFGIWKDEAAIANILAEKYKLQVVRLHSHIGSGSDPEVWKRVIGMNLDIVRRFPDITHLNLGGGYKVARMSTEKATDLQEIGLALREALEQFASETGRQLHFEIEPGTFLVANAGFLVCTIQDIVSTGRDGYLFFKLDGGMTEILRPSLYGAQHPMQVVKTHIGVGGEREVNCVVVGHCCESGDILTPAPGDAEALQTRTLPVSNIGDLLVIGGAGAYCSSMAAKNYNSFPEAPEILLRSNGTFACIRRRQTLEQMLANELDLS